MEKIASFSVDHRYIKPGIYLSRRDGDCDSYDLRFKKPNAGEYLSNIELHSVEHMFATIVRNSRIGDKVIYFGPMGCRTGFYLVVRSLPADIVKEVVREILVQIVEKETEMYGASEIECGNYKELSLDAAKKCCAEYLEAVDFEKADLNYPNGEQK